MGVYPGHQFKWHDPDDNKDMVVGRYRLVNDIFGVNDCLLRIARQMAQGIDSILKPVRDSTDEPLRQDMPPPLEPPSQGPPSSLPATIRSSGGLSGPHLGTLGSVITAASSASMSAGAIASRSGSTFCPSTLATAGSLPVTLRLNATTVSPGEQGGYVFALPDLAGYPAESDGGDPTGQWPFVQM